MEKGKIELTQKYAENTPAGGVVVGKRDGQTMIYDDASLGGYFVGKLHKDGGIKMINKSTGQPLEVQGSEVIITAPAVNDQTKHNFNGKMMTNREILSKINSDGGGVSFADGGDIPAKIHTTDKEYEYGGKMVQDSEIANHLGMNSTLKKGKQQFSSGGKTYDIDAIYNAIKKGKLRLKTKEVETFAMKYPVYDKKYSETVKTDFRKPNGLMVRLENGEEVLIDGNHRMNNAYLKGRKTIKTYYIEDPKQIAKFTKNNKFEMGGQNKDGGHLSKNKSLKQIAEMHNVSLAHINEELAKGLEVEKEHFDDFKERARVAKDHLVENPNYYSILEKAGLKNGGMVGKEDLVENSKKGDTPARDLNNYNDIMDLEADGIVGMESGLAFANGGNVNSQRDKVYDLKLDYKIGQKFEQDKLGGKYLCKILAMDFTVNENGEVNHNSYYIHYLDGNNNLEQSSHFKFLKQLKKEPNQVRINVPYSIGSDIYYESSEYSNKLLSLLKSTVNGFQVLYYGQRTGWFNYYLDSKESVDSKDAYSSVENYINKVLSEITSTKLSSLKKLNQFVEPTSEKIKVTVDYFVGQKFKLPIMGGFEDAEIVEIDLRFDKEKIYPNSERSIIKYKESDNRIREQELQYFIKEIGQQKPNEIEVIAKAKAKDDVLILHRYMGGSKLQITQVQGYVLKLDNTGVNLEYCVNDDCYDADSVYTSLENFKESITRKNKKKIDEVDGLSELLEMVKSGNYANGGQLENEPKEGDLITNFGKYGKSIFDVDDNYVYWLDQYASKYYCKKSDLSLNNLDDDGDDDGYYEDERNSWICNKIYADGGVTPYDANSEGDSIAMLNSGGGVGLPKVAYTKVTNTGASLVGLMGLKYNNYKEFKESVEEAYKPFVNIKPIRRSFVELEAYDENDNKLVSASTYIADQKNTVKNFNPTTGNYKNLEKSLANSRPRSFQKFDWEDWFLSKSNLSTTTAQMTNSGKFPEYYEFTQEVMSGFTKGKIYKINNPKRLEASGNFIDDEGMINGYGNNNSSYFKPSTEQAFLAQQGIASSSSSLPLNLSNTKVWIGDDERLSKAIQEVAFELGWEWSSGKIVRYTDSNALYFDSSKNMARLVGSRESFDNNPNKELNPQDILLAKKAVITTSSANSSSNKPFDFTDTKIDVEGNPNLSIKVQKKAFEDGWEWESGIGKTIDYNPINYLYFTKKSISDGFTASSFVNSPKREITEAEIFGSQTSNANSSTTSAQTYSKEDVQSVLVTYAGGQKYNALNEERLLDKIIELWTSGGRSKMSIILQPQGSVKTLSSPVNVLLDTIKTSKTSIQPSTLSNSELREYLSKDWYPELDWDDFFKEVKTTTKLDPYDANRITLIWKDNSGIERIDSIDIFNGSSGGLFIEKLKDIEAQREAKDVNVIIRVFTNDNNGNQFEKNDNFTISRWFQPSSRTNEEIKSIVEGWIDGINFDKFFEDVIPLIGTQASKELVEEVVFQYLNNSQFGLTKKTFTTSSALKQEIIDRQRERVKDAQIFVNGKNTSDSVAYLYLDDKNPVYNYNTIKMSKFEDILSDIIINGKYDWSEFFEKVTKTSKTIGDKKFTDFKEAVSALEGFASQASKKYNTADYEEGLELLKELKDDYSLALSLTPESSFMYERIEMMKKINEVQKEITKTTELRNGGAYYILSKVIDKLEKGENWKESGRGEIITNEVPEQELEAVIYTDKFKNWFGDWEKALITKEYDYVSKAITESGKPCVMYHGAKRIKYSYRQVSNGVVYLAENKSYAEWFSATDSPYQKQGDYLTQCFVNLKNPIDLTGFGVEEFDLRDIIQYIDALYPLAKIYDVLPPNVSMAIMNNQLIGRNFRAWYIIRQFPELNKHIRDNTSYDGFIYYENNPSDMIINEITGEMEENVTKATAVFNSNQVKLVDAMLFNSSLDDWRFEQGGKVN